MNIRLKYNAPATLTFSMICVTVLAIELYLPPNIMMDLFTAEGRLFFEWDNPASYIRMLLHVVGHRDWPHLFKNMSFILLLGPILEEKHGSWAITILIAITSTLAGLFNAFFVDSYLIGSSGVVFLMIVLISFTNIEKGEIPLSVIAVLAVYIYIEYSGFIAAKELPDPEEVSWVSHIIGGATGLLYGLICIVGGTRYKTISSKDASTDETIAV